jgi:hypothetical protein
VKYLRANVPQVKELYKEYRKWYICGNTLVDTENYAKKFAYDESYPSQAVLRLSGVPKKRNIEVEWIR